MLLSFALIFLLGMALGKILEKLGLPQLLGMLLTGILLGPYGLSLLDPELLALSPQLRQIALIIILTRAGLNLDLKDLKSGASIHVSNLNLPAGVKALTHGEDPVVATILAIRGGDDAAEETPAA